MLFVMGRRLLGVVSDEDPAHCKLRDVRRILTYQSSEAVVFTTCLSDVDAT
jgi:hypothetical protein